MLASKHAFADLALGGLAPAGMVFRWIYVRVKTVLVRGHPVPGGWRHAVGEADLDDGLGVLESVFPRYDGAQWCAVHVGQDLVIESHGEYRERMHGFVHAKTLDIRPLKHVRISLVGHLVGRQDCLKRDKPGSRQWLCLVDQDAQRKSNPGNHHGPTFDATVPVDAFLKRRQ